MEAKIEPQVIQLLLLILIGSALLSFYARWVVTATFPGAFELSGHILLLIALVFLYCFAATALLTKTGRGYIVSPAIVWSFIWLIIFIDDFYKTSSTQLNLDTLPSLLVMNLFALYLVFFMGYSQQFFIRKAFGFAGEEEECYYKSYTSDNYEKIASILLKKKWLYNVSGLKVKKRVKPTRLTVKAYHEPRDCYLFFLLDKKEERRTILNIVAYVKHATFFTSFIDCPDWCKELADNIISIIKNKGINLREEKGLALRRETFEYTLKEVKPWITLERFEKVLLPIFLSIILVLLFLVAHFALQMGPELIVAIITLIVTVIGILLAMHKRR